MQKYIPTNLLGSTLLGVSLIFSCFAQNTPNDLSTQHKKKSFSDDAGVLYWNLELPIYLTISSSPDCNEGFEIKDKASSNDAYPVYFKGHGIHQISRVTNKNTEAPQEAFFEVYVDGEKPLSKISFLNAKRYSDGDNTYYGKGLTVNMIARDKMSGLENLYYAINNSEYKAYNEDLNFGDEGTFELKCYAVDRVGNVEDLNSFNVNIDLTPPETTHSILRDQLNNILAPTTIIELLATDQSSGIERIRYRFENKNEATYTSPLKLITLKEGEHTLSYYSFDKVENKEVGKSFNFYLDKTPPKVSTEIIGDNYERNEKTYVSKRSKLKISATDNKAGLASIFYKVDGQLQKEYKMPIPVSDLTPGARYIAYKAIDKVNNETEGFKTDSKFGKLHFDNNKPIISIDYSGAKRTVEDKIYITSATKIKLIGSDTESGIQNINFKIDEGEYAVYSSPFSINEEGSHSIIIEGVDNVNNKLEKEYKVFVDNTGPEISYHLNTDQIGSQEIANIDKKIPVYAKHAKIYLEAVDKLSGTDKIYYTTNKMQERAYAGPIATTTTGLWNIKVSAVDKLGNRSQLDPIIIVVQ
jgi:hypothetical protein